MEKQYFASDDPIGEWLSFDMREGPAQVIGVVADVRIHPLGVASGEVQREVYVPIAQVSQWGARLALRTVGDPLALASAVRREIHAIDPDQPITEVQTMARIVAESTSDERFNALLLGAFAACAVLLAATGIYSVISYSVARLTHELGIRRAVGATDRNVAMMVLRRGLLPVGAGIALGLLGSLGAAHLMSSLLFEVQALDPIAFGLAPVVIVVVALAAVLVPGKRALAADPAAALRSR